MTDPKFRTMGSPLDRLDTWLATPVKTQYGPTS
jgi:hypothetical protein